jgi:single-strand DNA-binding protein
MSNDLNSCSFIGRAGKDPELKTLQSGKAVANFSIAVGRKFKDVDETEWVNCTAFDKLAEIIGQYVKKGSQIFINGRMRTEKYQKDGKDCYSTKIIINDMQLLGSKPSGGVNAEPVARPAPPKAPSKFEEDDDIPF